MTVTVTVRTFADGFIQRLTTTRGTHFQSNAPCSVASGVVYRSLLPRRIQAARTPQFGPAHVAAVFRNRSGILASLFFPDSLGSLHGPRPLTYGRCPNVLFISLCRGIKTTKKAIQPLKNRPTPHAHLFQYCSPRLFEGRLTVLIRLFRTNLSRSLWQSEQKLSALRASEIVVSARIYVSR